MIKILKQIIKIQAAEAAAEESWTSGVGEADGSRWDLTPESLWDFATEVSATDEWLGDLVWVHDLRIAYVWQIAVGSIIFIKY